MIRGTTRRWGRFASPSLAVAVGLALLGSGLAARTIAPKGERPSFAPVTATARPRPHPASTSTRPPVTVARAVPAALTADGLSLRSGPVPVPLELQLPSLGQTSVVTGVGMTTRGVMDAPMGPASDPVWQEAFWYRGSAIPGATSTTLLAGHVDDPLGRPGVFAHLDQLRPADPIVVLDTRTGLAIRYAVTGSETYTLAQAAEPAILARIYGAGPVQGTWPQPSVDGRSHLTLITCAGTFRHGTHDHRLAVYAIRVG